MTEAETVPLTDEELAAYNEIFKYQAFDEQGKPVSGTGSKPINQLLTSYYDRPQDINLVRLYSKDSILALKLHDGGFWFMSHQPIEEGAGKV